MLQQNAIVDGYDKAPFSVDVISQRVEAILLKTHFVPQQDLPNRHSRYWHSQKIGAVSLIGSFNKQPAVAKIQLTKLNTSEADMIERFANQNRSKIIRPPNIYQSLPWNDQLQAEMVVYEAVLNPIWRLNQVVQPDKLELFFSLYLEYKANCLQEPWLIKPHTSFFHGNYQKMRDIIKTQRNLSHLTDQQDKKLLQQARKILKDNLKPHQLTFQHGHFQPEDLYQINSNEVVLTSNLYWSWRQPLYDLVFGYHWIILNQEHDSQLTSAKLEKLRNTLKQYMYQTAQQIGDDQWEKHLQLALLERTASALMIDRFLLNHDSQKETTEHIIVEGIRNELRELLKKWK